jgi:tRNA-2-methylthio-N6-dimethylallyladenosine synthase
MSENMTDIKTNPDGSNTRKVFVKTYGCQMNVYDSQRMADSLAQEGYVTTDTPDDADLVLLNTCHIREKASEKLYSALGRLRKMKDARGPNGKQLTIGVAGCVAQAEGQEILRRAPNVDLVIGPQTYHRLPSALARVRNGEKIVETEYAIEDKFEHLPAPKREETRKRGVFGVPDGSGRLRQVLHFLRCALHARFGSFTQCCTDCGRG